MTKKKRYKRYSPEFKREVSKRVSEKGVTDVVVCDELGINARHDMSHSCRIINSWRNADFGNDVKSVTIAPCEAGL